MLYRASHRGSTYLKEKNYLIFILKMFYHRYFERKTNYNMDDGDS